MMIIKKLSIERVIQIIPSSFIYFIPVFREKESKNGDGQKQQLILVTLVLQN